MNRLYNDDCLNILPTIPDASVDMVLADLPYGVLNRENSSAKWDTPIPLDVLWSELRRVVKVDGAIVMFGQGMFSAELMFSARDMWRYNLVWEKDRPTGFLNAGRMPLRSHEDIMVFYRKLPVYNPQMVKCEPHQRNHSRGKCLTHTNRCYGDFGNAPDRIMDEKHPRSIVKFNREHDSDCVHPTQKPVALAEWLISTYTNPGDVVLDPTMGSGTTGVACRNLGRRFIGMELDAEYFDLSLKRIGPNLAHE